MNPSQSSTLASFAKESGNVSRSELVYQQIKENILTSVYPAGFQALEPKLAEMLGVSRTPVREALIRLEAEGFVKLTPRRGMQVVAYSRESFIELQTLAGQIEGVALEQASMAKIDRAVLEGFEARLQVFANQSSSEAADWLTAFENLRVALVGLSANAQLVEFYKGLSAKLHRASLSVVSLLPDRNDSCFQYAELLSMIKVGQWAEAKELQKKMLNSQQEIFALVIDKYQLAPL